MAEKEMQEIEIVSSAVTLRAQEEAAIDIQIATAHRYPRTISLVKGRILKLATTDQATAEKCFYTVPRDGKVIEGPSIRLAEIIATSYGNMRVQSRIIAIEEKYVVAQGVCHDLETNLAESREVRRRITNKAGRRFSDDMIMTTCNAACSIAKRNAITAVAPMAVFQTELIEIRRVGMGDARTLQSRTDAMIAYFDGLKVDKKRVCGIVGKRAPSDLTLEDVATLRGIATAIKDGETTPEEAFAESVTESPGGKLLKPGKHSTKKPEPVKVESEVSDVEPEPEEKAEEEQVRCELCQYLVPVGLATKVGDYWHCPDCMKKEEK